LQHINIYDPEAGAKEMQQQQAPESFQDLARSRR
jgi:hypothetical protein